MAVATYFYIENVRRMMRTAVVPYLLHAFVIHIFNEAIVTFMIQKYFTNNDSFKTKNGFQST